MELRLLVTHSVSNLMSYLLSKRTSPPSSEVMYLFSGFLDAVERVVKTVCSGEDKTTSSSCATQQRDIPDDEGLPLSRLSVPWRERHRVIVGTNWIVLMLTGEALPPEEPPSIYNGRVRPVEESHGPSRGAGQPSRPGWFLAHLPSRTSNQIIA